MTIEKLKSGSYRIKQMYKGKYYSVTVDHKPTQKEALLLLSEKMEGAETAGNFKTFEKCALEYIESKSNILSPSTLGGYQKVLRQISDDFKKKNIFDIEQIDVNFEVNRYADGRSPKTVANFHGFISAVFGLFRPKFKLTTTLPQKIKFEPYVATEEDIKKILEASKTNTKYHICFQLGVLSLRRSEVCALTLEDFDFKKNTVSINKALVYDENNKTIVKHLTKTTEGMRTIPIPVSLSKEVMQNGFVIDVVPHMLVKTLHDYQHQLKIPEFRFHDLRHFYASYAHEKGMSDANIMATGGWKTDNVMKNIYRHSMEKQKQESQQKVINQLFG